jgi:hypothetical protein
MAQNLYYKRVGRHRDIKVETTSLSRYIKRAFGDVPEDFYCGVIIALPDDAPKPLRQV